MKDTTMFSVAAILLLAVVAVFGMTAMANFRPVVVLSTGGSPAVAAPVEPVVEQPILIEVPEEEPIAEEILYVQEDGEIDVQQLDGTPSLAETYYQRYQNRVSSYSFTMGCDVHGSLKVKVSDGVIKYKAVEQLFEYDNETNMFIPSTYHTDITKCFRRDADDWLTRSKDFLKDVRKGKLDIINYVEWDTIEDGYKGCFILSGSMSLANCVQNSSGENLIIHEGFQFMHPQSPHDYLIERFDEEPIEVRLNREFKSRTMVNKAIVDELEYRNEDGSRTVLYVHTFYGLPLEVEYIGAEAPVYFDSISYTLQE